MTLIKHRGRVVDTETGQVYGIEIATHVDPSGYKQVYIEREDGRQRTQQAHRFIWEAAHGPIPDGMTINHLNGDKADNRLANLECVTLQDNIRHAYRTGLAKGMKGTRHPAARIGNIQALAIRAMCDLGFSPSELARNIHNLSRRQIAAIGARQAWGHLPEFPARIEDL